jgi:hypothetical protein
MARVISNIGDFFLLASIKNFPVVLGAGICICLACFMLASGSEALFHHDLPLIGWYITVLGGGKLLINASKLKYGRMMMSALGYAAMSAVIMVFIVWGALNLTLR